MQKTAMKISLTLQGPLLTQSSNPGELGLDAVVARHDDDQGTPYLPGTLIAGKLRQALEELQSVVRNQDNGPDWFAPKIDDWLGRASKSDNLPLAKQFFLTDFDLDESSLPDDTMIRDRITIDPVTGAVQKQQIAMLENPFSSGGLYTFTGHLHFFAPADQVADILRHVKTAFRWFTQVGAMKSIGFGQVDKVAFSLEQEAIIAAPSAPTEALPERIALRFKPAFPFCLAKKPVPDGNRFESEAIIPGSAILGAIATTWNQLFGRNGSIVEPESDPQRKELGENFSRLRITHAFPSSSGAGRPVVAPLSLVKVAGDPTLYDVSRMRKPCLIRPGNRAKNSPEPVDFALDWKDDASTLKEYPWPYIRFRDWGWAPLKTEMRVRTAIDPASGRSKENELFVYEQIIPEQTTWYCELDLSRIEEANRAKVFEQLRTLVAHGVGGFSKTKTTADLQFDTQSGMSPYITGSTAPLDNSEWVVILQTDTLLGCPKSLDETSGAEELCHMYTKAWQELSDGTLELVRYFARQKISGGEHRWIVFQRRHKPYRPWLLTEAGSVFVLRATGDLDGARNKIEDWLRHGLPLTSKSFGYYRIDEQCPWRTCPFIPQNGYGEIAVNLDTGEKTVALDDNSAQIVSIDRVED